MQDPLTSQRICVSPAGNDVCADRDQQQRQQRGRGTGPQEQQQKDGEQEPDLEAVVADSAVRFEVRCGQYYTTSGEVARRYPPMDVLRRNLVDVTATCR